MTNSILIKRSAVAGKVPVVTDISLGELAINTNDGRLFLKKNNGTDSIVEIGSVSSVSGKTGVVALTKTDVGLSNVDNTADLSKPINNLTQAALDNKQNISASLAAIAALAGTSGLLSKTGLNTWALDTSAYYTSATGVPWSSVTGVPQVLPNLTTAVQVAPTSSTAIIPYDNTTPLKTEGTQIAQAVYTPSSPNSKMQVDGTLQIDCGTSTRTFVLALFKDGVCIGATALNFITTGKPQQLSFNFTDLNMGSAFGVSNVTYTLRLGVATAATWYVNRMATAMLNSMMATNSITFSEYV